MATRYSYKVDLDDTGSSHSLAVLQIPPGSTVLDIGAADGSVARSLAARGCRIWGLESDEAAAAAARSVCQRVIVGDVETLDLDSALEGKRFDFILLLDVLEHLRDPLATLSRVSRHLVPGGRVIVSIPNVTHGAVRLSLMSGSFTYTETGLLDRTHLRFFDRRSAEALMADAGLRIVERLRVKRELHETEIPVDPSSVPPPVLKQLEEDPDATTYQFVFAAIQSDDVHVTAGANESLTERLQRRIEELESQYRNLEAHHRSTEFEAQTRAMELESRARTESPDRGRSDELRGELEVRMRELGQRDFELRHLQADLMVKEAFITELRQLLGATREELERTRAQIGPAVRLVTKLRVRAERYPRLYAWLRSIVRRLG